MVIKRYRSRFIILFYSKRLFGYGLKFKLLSVEYQYFGLKLIIKSKTIRNLTGVSSRIDGRRDPGVSQRTQRRQRTQRETT